jgi:hypothetical protein
VFESRSKESKQQIRSLLIVLFASGACAFFFMMVLLKFYSPKGEYVGRNVLLDPALITHLTKNSTQANNSPSQFAIDHVEYSFYNAKERKWETYDVATAEYQKFYNLVSKDVSISEPTDEIINIFAKGPLATVVVIVRGGNEKKSSIPFQEINFVNNSDFYRIELRASAEVGKWAYFHHPQIYEKVHHMFTPEKSTE